jgi:hypothetical protein
VFSLLSRPLSLAASNDRLEISAWVLQLRSFCRETIDFILAAPDLRSCADDGITARHPPVFADSKIGQKHIRPSLDLRDLFVKPIRLRRFSGSHVQEAMAHPYRIEMSHTLEVFRRLATANASVVLPLGWLQVPPKKQQEAIHNLVVDSLSTFRDCKDNDNLNFQPCFVYPRLSQAWTSAPPHNEKHTAPYISALSSAVRLVAESKVVHMDLRPANIMWTCTCKDSKQGAAAAVPDGTRCNVSVRIVDWEDGRLAGEFVSTAMYRSAADAGDHRYPLSSSQADNVAVTSALDQWSLGHICEFVRQDSVKKYTAFMAATREE